MSGRAAPATLSRVKGHIRYERAFQHYLAAHRVTHVVVNEAKKASFRGARLKSFDFIVYSTRGRHWLVDIKGRRWTVRRDGQRPRWENWITLDDLDGLSRWQEVFGGEFRALLVFAYAVESPGDPPAEIVHAFEGVRYAFAGIPMDDYRIHARLRSPKWGTVCMPRREFADAVRPIADWL